MYQVNTLEVCAQGMERLRNQDEFILVAYIDDTTTAADLREQWLADIQCCEREDDFDYEAAESAVTEFADSLARNVFTKPDPYNLEQEEDEISADQLCGALLYLSKVDESEGSRDYDDRAIDRDDN